MIMANLNRHTFQRSKKGFTLIELLVVVGIIAILVSLVLPAIFSAREAARNIQCKTNLGQLGIALSSYEAAHRMFPPAALETGNGPGVSSNRLSGFLYMLPYMEQVALFNAANLSLVILDQPGTAIVENQTTRNTRLAMFLCPSDGESNHKNSYRFNYGCYNEVAPSKGALIADGPFATALLPRAASITDGLSNTAFVSERIAGSFQVNQPTKAADLKLVDWPGNGNVIDRIFLPYCLASKAKGWFTLEGRYWYFTGMEYTQYNHNGLPNDINSSCGGGNYGLQPPRSYHSKSVNVLFGDGHSESVSNSVQGSVWKAIGTSSSGDL